MKQFILIGTVGTALFLSISARDILANGAKGKVPQLNQSTATNHVATNGFVAADQKEPPFPLEKKLGLKRPLLSGVVSTNEFDKIEKALVSQFGEYLQASGTDASLKAFEKEIKAKPDKLKVGRTGLSWLVHLGKKKTVKNTGKTEMLANVKKDLEKVKKDLTQFKSWTLEDVKLQDVKSVTPLRTVVRDDAGRFVSLYQVSTEKHGTRYAVIADDIPKEQAELRRVLLADHAFLRRGPVDFAGFATNGHDHLAFAIVSSLWTLDHSLPLDQELKPLPTTPAAALDNYIKRDVAAVASARKGGTTTGKKSGKGVKFKGKPGDWFIGIKGGIENGQSNIGIIYQEGKVGFEIGGTSKDIYVTPRVTMPGGGNTLSFRLPVYEFTESPLRVDRAQTDLSNAQERGPQSTPNITATTKVNPAVPVEKNAGSTFDETQDRLFAAKWMKDPALTSQLAQRGYKMQGIFDSTFWFFDHSVYFDQYSMIIDKAPNANPGEALLSFFLQDPSQFVNRRLFDGIALFKPERQQGTATVGDLYHIDFLGPVNGTVMLVEKGKNYFILQTVESDKTGRHPENGAREFGFEDLPDGSQRFYMRAAASSDFFLADKLGPFFQRWTWESALNGIKEKIEFFGGKVRKRSETPRFDPLEQPAVTP